MHSQFQGSKLAKETELSFLYFELKEGTTFFRCVVLGNVIFMEYRKKVVKQITEVHSSVCILLNL